MKPYSKEFRGQVLAACDKGRSTREVATYFDVSESWVWRIKQESRELNETAPLLQRRRVPLWAAFADQIKDVIKRKSDLTLEELKRELALVVDGAINGELFLGWIIHQLVPTLQPGNIVVMRNLGAHKVAGVREAITAAGARLVYLPPHNPDLNPIELVFSKFKWLLKCASARTVEILWSVCSDVLDRFTESECRNCFRHCGYRYT
jgi:transposase